ncbi:MAG: DUF434 domain-containing protein [Candidatus Hydrogenedentes bacterium]|nr:DUF434 domain-containing protein [Candidatus Hydrogenedentota bacterium]
MLRKAVADLSYLLTRGYSDAAALKLVGDHYQLHARHRIALSRAACSDDAVARRKAHEVAAQDSRGRRLLIDGYNVLISVESALSGGILIRGRDGCIRDIAGIHGSYRKVVETLPALKLIGETLSGLGAAGCTWYLDAPVSNSGSLASLMREEAGQRGWPWTVEVEQNPDRILELSPEIVVTSDSIILDRAQHWLNLIPLVIAQLGNADIVDLG